MTNCYAEKRCLTSRMIKLWPWYVLILVIALVDQYTKILAVRHIELRQFIEVFPFFDLTLWRNYGAAFSFLDQQGGPQRWFFTGISAVVSLFLLVWWIPSQKRLLSIAAFSFVAGGAIGNLYDRAVLGYVVDFISIHYQQHRFPTFNIADSAISVGAALLFLEWFVCEPRDRRRQENSSTSNQLDQSKQRDTDA